MNSLSISQFQLFHYMISNHRWGKKKRENIYIYVLYFDFKLMNLILISKKDNVNFVPLSVMILVTTLW